MTQKDNFVEVYKRRPGGFWRLVHDGREDLCKLWLKRQGHSHHGAEFLLLPIGTFPTEDMEPDLVIPAVSAD